MKLSKSLEFDFFFVKALLFPKNSGRQPAVLRVGALQTKNDTYKASK